MGSSYIYTGYIFGSIFVHKLFLSTEIGVLRDLNVALSDGNVNEVWKCSQNSSLLTQGLDIDERDSLHLYNLLKVCKYISVNFTLSI